MEKFLNITFQKTRKIEKVAKFFNKYHLEMPFISALIAQKRPPLTERPL